MSNEYVYDKLYTRNLGIVTEPEQRALSRSLVAIAGLGGIGGNVATILARTGVGRFRLCDFDTFEESNVNRQFGARADTIGRSKAEVMSEEIRRINPGAEVEVIDAPFTRACADRVLEGADIAVDAIDFYEIDAHIEFHREARRRGLFVLMGSPVGFSACLQVYDPEGMSFEAYSGITDDMPPVEKQLRYATGVVPELAHLDYYDVSASNSKTDFLRKTGPAIAPAVTMAAGLVAAEVVILLLRRREPLAIPYTQQFDPYTYRYHKTFTPGGMRMYDPRPTLARIEDKGSLISQVLTALYQKPKAQRADVNGTSLYFNREGQGAPLLLLNPLGVDNGFWARQLQRLKQHFSVISFDYRGTGASAPLEVPASTELFAEDARALLDHLKVESAHVVSVAFGSLVAQQLAARHPERINKLVLAASYLKADPELCSTVNEWRATATTHGMEIVFDRCVGHLFTPEYLADARGDFSNLRTFVRIAGQNPQAFSQIALAGLEHDGRQLASAIRAPTLVIHGAGDRLVAPEAGHAVARAVGGNWRLVANAPHFFSWEKHPAFNSHIAAFLQDLLAVANTL